MTALPSIKLTAMPWKVISAGGGDHHHPPCRIGLKLKIEERSVWDQKSKWNSDVQSNFGFCVEPTSRFAFYFDKGVSMLKIKSKIAFMFRTE